MILFEKYHGAGNDFIMIDLRKGDETIYTPKLVNSLCDRHFGIGADGLILLLNGQRQPFRMKYFNADGYEGTMCGNGGRCFTGFAKSKGLLEAEWTFEGIDGDHKAWITGPNRVILEMKSVSELRKEKDGYFLDTGSPHFVTQVADLENTDVFNLGREIRYQDRWGKAGSNINFITIIEDGKIAIRTYERGVENETLACGTGVVAAAISAHYHTGSDKKSFFVNARGGQLIVGFSNPEPGFYSDVRLEGDYQYVFTGEFPL